MSLLRLEARRLIVRAFPWTLVALSVAWLAWTFLLALDAFLKAQTKLAALPDAPGFTDLVAVPLLGQLALIALLIVPLATMHTLAGERRAGTLAVLFGAGQTPARIVLAKYAVALIWMLVLLALTALMPLALTLATHPDWGKLLAALLGVVLLLSALTAIGVACSAFASHPALAAGAALLIAMALQTLNYGARLEGIDSGVINYLALPTHLQPLLRGLLDSQDVIYFVLLTALALLLAARRLAADKVRG